MLVPYLRRVAVLSTDGLSEKEIAHRLGRTPGSVNQYFQRIYRELGISGRFALLKYVNQHPEEFAEAATI